MASPSTHGRPASLVATCDQWVRATHARTAVDGAGGVLTLGWSELSPPDGAETEGEHDECRARGLAVDRLCRVYRLWAHGFTRQTVGSTIGGLDYSSLEPPFDFVGRSTDGPAPKPVSGSTFASRGDDDIVDGSDLAIDGADRLFVADAGAGHIAVLDLWSRRLLRTIPIAVPRHPERRPVAVTAVGDSVLALVANPTQILRLSATRGPTEIEMPAGAQALPPDAAPSRISAFADGQPVVLFETPDGDGHLVARGLASHRIGPASDIAVDDEGLVVVAPCASATPAFLRRFHAAKSGWTRRTPLDAAGYAGSGLVVLADGRIGYYSQSGFRLAVRGAVRYETDGHCVTYRLDSGTARNQWGRVLVEGCVPPGTSLEISAMTTDDEFETSIPAVAADPAHCDPADPTLTPAMAPTLLVDGDPVSGSGPVHRRTSSVTPWLDPDDHDDFFEAPVRAAPGRFLWLVIRLRGDSRRTPRLHEVRVEHQAHTLMDRLPAIFTSDAEHADFLHRYLAMFDGMLHDLEVRSRAREILVDPYGSPAEALGWLASFFGLTLDDRWAEAAQRQLIQEIVPLYRRRGTLWSISRYIEIYLAGDRATDPTYRGPRPILIEHFRLRGLGGPLVGDDPQSSNRSVVGHGFRVGGAVDPDGAMPLSDGTAGPVFHESAHRFSVLIPTSLGAEEEATIRHILDTERPAHTAYELCTVDAGLRAGVGAHLGMSTIIGPTGGFEGAVTDLSLIGRGALLGGPTTGIAVESSRLGVSARVG